MSPVSTIPALVALAMLTACQSAEPPVPDPAADYAENCATCHGVSGKGDGPLAGELPKAPADLTGLSARNGGAFPTTRVMAQIWGYAGAKGHGVMPEYSTLMEGETVPYDGGDGIMTPTPVRLVALAEYLKTLQE